MSFRQVLIVFLTLCLLCLAFSACVVRRRTITRKGASRSQPLLVANRDTLVQSLAKQYEAIKDFNATVDMVPALGSAEKSKITEYKDVRAFVLYRAPKDIRLIGLYPVVRSKAFDMVSNGIDFKLYLPSQSRFITGANEVREISKNKIENLRPQHFLEALMVRPVDPTDKLLIENFTDEDNAYYILQLVRENAGNLQLARTIWFNRIDLLLSRELVFEASGNILTDARYSQWKTFDNVSFPKHVEINRPFDEYGVVMDVVKMEINKGVSDDKFVLDQPEGSKLQVLGKSQ